METAKHQTILTRIVTHIAGRYRAGIFNEVEHSLFKMLGTRSISDFVSAFFF
jgi:hypothetical protein